MDRVPTGGAEAFLELAASEGATVSESAAAKLAGGSAVEDRLSLIVFSGSLDRLIAAFVLATGAAAMGTQVSMFFTFWGTAALRDEQKRVRKSWFYRMMGWMLPRGSKRLPLSQMNMAGGGALMIRRIMRTKGVASLEEMMALAADLGVEINICTMSMDLLGMKEDEMISYPNLGYCGAAKFLEVASASKTTLFL
jgi:peroxiredoxin family protein